MSTVRDAFSFVGDDAPLTDEQLARLMEQMEANRLEFGDDPGFEGDIKQLTDDDILERLGLGNADDALAFEARWGGDDE